MSDYAWIVPVGIAALIGTVFQLVHIGWAIYEAVDLTLYHLGFA